MPELPLSPVRTHGDLVFVSGQVGIEADGTIPGQFARQAELAIAALLAALARAGAGPDDLLKTTVYLVRPEDVTEMNQIYARFFSSDPWPARTTLVSGLARPGLLFEIDAIAHSSNDG